MSNPTLAENNTKPMTLRFLGSASTPTGPQDNIILAFHVEELLSGCAGNVKRALAGPNINLTELDAISETHRLADPWDSQEAAVWRAFFSALILGVV